MSHLISKASLLLFLSTFIIQSCTLSIPDKVQTEYSNLTEEIDFNYHIKPILSDRCFQCHGPDSKTRKAGLRLDIEEIAFSKLASGKKAFSSSSIYKSEVAHRILSNDPLDQMPPPESKLSLSDNEKALILRWIDQGAKWKEHWSFIKPKIPQIPENIYVDSKINNEIDYFVNRKLKKLNLKFSDKASKERLLRRVSMDLRGLPPSIDEIDDFLNDNSPNAYEKVVDRFLNSVAHAEMLTLDWLDLSRYADSHGLHADGARTMWPWRDWVINSFEKNMPYDQFVTWQIAGDLFQNPTREQKLATAFNRNSPMTAEGGAIDEEWRLHYVFDRTETLSTAFLGLTVACAKCHDHKFDPISQRDYYQLASFFNNIKELGMTGDDGDFGPLLPMPSKEKENEISQIKTKIDDKEKEINIQKNELREFYSYVENLKNKNSSEKNIIKNLKSNYLIGHYPLDKIKKSNNSNNKKIFIVDNNFYAKSQSKAEVVDGIKDKALKFSTDIDYLNLEKVPNFETNDSFSGSFWINTDDMNPEKTQHVLGTSGQKNDFWRGWDIYLDNENYINMRLINVLPTNLIHVKSSNVIEKDTWNHITFSYNGSAKSSGIRIFINGKEANLDVKMDNLYKSIHPIPVGKKSQTGFPLNVRKKDIRPLRVGRSGMYHSGDKGLFSGKIDDIYLFSKDMTNLESLSLFNSYDISKRNVNETIIKNHWIESDYKILRNKAKLSTLRKNWLKIMEPVIEVMVMEEMKKPRDNYLLNRGSYLEPSHKVGTDVPENLPKMDSSLPKNRLGLAKWLFSNENPLTSRVTVNRYWQMIFGFGLVRTPEDFGVQGMLPSHPELLDWLSIYLINNNWNIKKLIKLMVMSHVYQQKSNSNDKLNEIDPNNFFLARSNSYKLPAEIIRDNALASSGLLVKKVGGPSVKPYQPDGLWLEKNSFSADLYNYKKNSGDSLYRRGMYTFIKRTSPPPSMIALDGTSREVCTVRREKTNTPLQALVLMNDPQFFEASRILAERIQKEGGENYLDQIKYGFRLAISRNPKDEELKILKELYESQLKFYKSNPKMTNQILKVGDKKFDRSLNKYRTAALTMVSNTILNHDETYLKR